MLAARPGLARAVLSLSIIDASISRRTRDRPRKRYAFRFDGAGSGRSSTTARSKQESRMRPSSEDAIEGGVKTPLSCLAHPISSSSCLPSFSPEDVRRWPQDEEWLASRETDSIEVEQCGDCRIGRARRRVDFPPAIHPSIHPYGRAHHHYTYSSNNTPAKSSHHFPPVFPQRSGKLTASTFVRRT